MAESINTGKRPRLEDLTETESGQVEVSGLEKWSEMNEIFRT